MISLEGDGNVFFVVCIFKEADADRKISSGIAARMEKGFAFDSKDEHEGRPYQKTDMVCLHQEKI